MNGTPGLRISDVDRDALRAMELTGQMCFHCPLLEDTYPEPVGPDSCLIRAADLEPLATDPRSGIKIAVREGRIVGYAVFGRPDLFRNLEGFPFEVDPDALLVAALYATPESREGNIDVDLLIGVMDFAREHDYSAVQVVCRPAGSEAPEARTEILGAAGFSLSDEIDGLCLGQTTVEQWDSDDREDEADADD